MICATHDGLDIIVPISASMPTYICEFIHVLYSTSILGVIICLACKYFYKYL